MTTTYVPCQDTLEQNKVESSLSAHRNAFWIGRFVRDILFLTVDISKANGTNTCCWYVKDLFCCNTVWYSVTMATTMSDIMLLWQPHCLLWCYYGNCWLTQLLHPPGHNPRTDELEKVSLPRPCFTDQCPNSDQCLGPKMVSTNLASLQWFSSMFFLSFAYVQLDVLVIYLYKMFWLLIYISDIYSHRKEIYAWTNWIEKLLNAYVTKCCVFI